MKLIIEWKHLEVEGDTCERCFDTGENLAREIERLNRSLNPKGHEIVLQETLLSGDEISESNMVLLDGKPIEEWVNLKVDENYCESCSELLDKEVNCRTVIYNGKQYDEIPPEAISQAVHKALGLDEAKPVFKIVSSCCCGNNGNC